MLIRYPHHTRDVNYASRPSCRNSSCQNRNCLPWLRWELLGNVCRVRQTKEAVNFSFYAERWPVWRVLWLAVVDIVTSCILLRSFCSRQSARRFTHSIQFSLCAAAAAERRWLDNWVWSDKWPATDWHPVIGWYSEAACGVRYVTGPPPRSRSSRLPTSDVCKWIN